MSWEIPDKWRDEDGPHPEAWQPKVPIRRVNCVATHEPCECPVGGVTEAHCLAKLEVPVWKLRRHIDDQDARIRELEAKERRLALLEEYLSRFKLEPLQRDWLACFDRWLEARGELRYADEGVE